MAPVWIAYGAVSALVALFAATTYLVLRVLIEYDIRAAYFIFAIWCEVIANLAGFAAGAIAPIIGTENLIFVLVLALLLIALLCRIIAKRHGIAASIRRDERSNKPPEPLSASLKSPNVGAIAATILVLFTVLTIGVYQFKVIARSTYPSRDELASFMGTFYGTVGFVVTPQILKRWGVIGAAAALPLVFLSSSALLVILPTITTATILKTSDNALQFSIFDVTLQLLLFPFPTAQREHSARSPSRTEA